MDKALGQKGEDIAAKYLTKKGYTIIRRNFRTKTSEIDIIAKKDDTLCFVEVKTRSSVEYGTPCQAVDYYKQKKIIRGAMAYVSNTGDDCTVRFDVIEVYHNKKALLFKYKINHIPDAFQI